MDSSRDSSRGSFLSPTAHIRTGPGELGILVEAGAITIPSNGSRSSLSHRQIQGRFEQVEGLHREGRLAVTHPPGYTGIQFSPSTSIAPRTQQASTRSQIRIDRKAVERSPLRRPIHHRHDVRPGQRQEALSVHARRWPIQEAKDRFSRISRPQPVPEAETASEVSQESEAYPGKRGGFLHQFQMERTIHESRRRSEFGGEQTRREQGGYDRSHFHRRCHQTGACRDTCDRRDESILPL